MKNLLLIVLILLQLCRGNEATQQQTNLQDLSTIFSRGKVIVGDWNSMIFTQKQLDFFTNSGSLAEASILQQGENISIQITLQNTDYKEGKQIQFILSLSNYNTTNNTWSDNNSLILAYEYEYFKEVEFKQCLNQYSIQVQQNDLDESFIFQGQIQSQQCNLNINFSLKSENQNFLGLSFYIAFVAVISLITIYSITFIIELLINNQGQREKLSSVSLALLTYYQWYFFAMNLFSNYPNIVTYIYDHQKSQFYMMIPSFCFMTSYFFSVKLFMLTWRFNNLDDLFDLQQRKRALLYLLMKYYIGFACFCAIVFIFDYYNWLLIINALYMLPQIINSALKGSKQLFIPQYIFGILITNIIYPLYLRGCPYNFKGLIPSELFVSMWIPMNFILIGIIVLQYYFGSRWFVPSCFIPTPFNYYLFQNVQGAQDECYICLSSLSDDPLNDETKKNQDDTIKKLLLPRIMQTPCKHQFHESCLKAWLDVKMECPACRETLPILE